jgi:hypothetical protein
VYGYWRITQFWVKVLQGYDYVNCILKLLSYIPVHLILSLIVSSSTSLSYSPISINFLSGHSWKDKKQKWIRYHFNYVFKNYFRSEWIYICFFRRLTGWHNHINPEHIMLLLCNYFRSWRAKCEYDQTILIQKYFEQISLSQLKRQKTKMNPISFQLYV